MNNFDPTQVPAGTIKDMSKRLSKHPEMKDVSLSKCQEVMARTFGHPHLHALKARNSESLAREAILDPGVRIELYSLMVPALESKVSVFHILEKIEQMAQRGTQWKLRDLARGLLEELKKGHSLGQAMTTISECNIPTELFLIDILEPQNNLERAIEECKKLAEKEGDKIDYSRLLGKSAEAEP